jgi:hypothetical protein
VREVSHEGIHEGLHHGRGKSASLCTKATDHRVSSAPWFCPGLWQIMGSESFPQSCLIFDGLSDEISERLEVILLD